MTTVINNPGDNGNGAGWLIAIVIVIILLFVFFVYGLPVLKNSAPADNGGAQINVQIPAGNNGGGDAQ